MYVHSACPTILKPVRKKKQRAWTPVDRARCILRDDCEKSKQKERFSNFFIIIWLLSLPPNNYKSKLLIYN